MSTLFVYVVKMHSNSAGRICMHHSSKDSVKMSEESKLEIFFYPGHLTHILQGPDVVLNKPISTVVSTMLHNKMLLTGNNDMTRLAFMATVDYAVKDVCTPTMVKKAFSATGIMPYNPSKIDLSLFPSTSPDSYPNDSPLKATCTSCRKENVELHPLVRQNIIPKHLADVFFYTPPLERTRKRLVQ